MFVRSSNNAGAAKPLALLALLLAIVLLASPLKAGAQAIEPSTDDQIITIDSDQDELSDEEELRIGTDPYNYDSDGDALGDGAEVRVDGWGTNPLKGDTDDDGYWDGDELFTYGTDPKDAESHPDQQVMSTIRISVRGLPVDYSGNDFVNDSTALEGIDLMVHFPGSDIGHSGTTDEAGIATFNNLQEGNYEVILNIPGEAANFVTFFGVEDEFEPREHEGQDTNQPIVYLGPSEQLNGTFYVLPIDSGAGEQELSSFQIQVRGLPVEYAGSQWWNDSDPLSGIDVTVAIPGSEFAVSARTDADGRVYFDDLGEGEYMVILGVPGDFADFVTYFGREGDTEPRQHDGRNTNQPVVYLNGGELLYGTFYVSPVDAGAEPTPTPTATPGKVGGEPIKRLPNTGAGEADSSSGLGLEVALALMALVSLATLGTVVTRRRG